MKSIRFVTVIVFLIVLMGWMVSTFISSSNKDTIAPVISADADSIVVSVKDGDAGLLRGLHAYDDQDGDLSDSILIGNRSKFIQKGESRVEFLVFDSNNNVGSYFLNVKYEDYTSPEFKLLKPFVFEKGSSVRVLDRLRLKDCIDGDISDKIKIVSSNVDVSKCGLYSMGIEASNKYGDLVSIKVPVLIVDSVSNLELSDYFVTVEKGSKHFDPMSYVKSSSGDVVVENGVNLNVEGCYLVTFSDDSGESAMIVWVRDSGDVDE